MSETLLAAMIAITHCPECKARPGEPCYQGKDASYVCPLRWTEAKTDLPGNGKCQVCRFVQVKPGEIAQGTRPDYSYRPARPAEYYCRRFPPRRSLGDSYHLTQVDPLGWCGEFVPY